MISIVVFLGVATLIASAPTENKNTIINVEGPEGRHLQTGEPGKAVSGYFTSRDSDGMEHRTMYVADENGFRATGDHLPVSPFTSLFKFPAAFPSVYPVASLPRYGYRFGPAENYYLNYPFYNPNIVNPNVPGGKLISAKDYLPAFNDDDTTLTEQEITDLTERGPLTPVLLPMMLMNKKNIMLMMLANKIMMALG